MQGSELGAWRPRTATHPASVSQIAAVLSAVTLLLGPGIKGIAL